VQKAKDIFEPLQDKIGTRNEAYTVKIFKDPRGGDFIISLKKEKLIIKDGEGYTVIISAFGQIEYGYVNDGYSIFLKDNQYTLTQPKPVYVLDTEIPNIECTPSKKQTGRIDRSLKLYEQGEAFQMYADRSVKRKDKYDIHTHPHESYKRYTAPHGKCPGREVPKSEYLKHKNREGHEYTYMYPPDGNEIITGIQKKRSYDYSLSFE